MDPGIDGLETYRRIVALKCNVTSEAKTILTHMG